MKNIFSLYSTVLFCGSIFGMEQSTHITYSKKGATPLHQAAGSGNIETLKAWLRSGIDPNIHNPKTGDTPLHYAAKSGCSSTTAVLLEQPKTSINTQNKKGETPLDTALVTGNTKTVKLLLEKDAQVNKLTPLQVAAIFSHCRLARYLLHSGVDINEGKRTPVSLATLINDVTMLKLLLKTDPDVNKPTNLGQTPLHIATQGGHLVAAQLLLAHGAKKTKKDSEHKTPTDYAKTDELRALLR